MCDRSKRISFLLIILFAGIIHIPRINAQENPEVKAIQLFNSGNFNNAELIFKKLLGNNNDSPILNYYYGASRTENGHFGEEELNYLKKAGKNITPDRLHYYLAVQYHARGKWDQALKFYNQFRLSVPEMEQKELELSKKIQLCYNQINPFEESMNSLPPTSQIEIIEKSMIAEKEENQAVKDSCIPLMASANELDLLEDSNNKEITNADALFLPREALPDLPGVEPTIPEGTPVRFQVNNYITYLYTSQFQTEEGKNLFEKAMKLQQQQENILAEAEKTRTAYKNTRLPEELENLATRIIALENESFHLEEDIKTMFSEARNVENEFWENTGPVVRNNFMMKQEKILTSQKKDDLSQEIQKELLIDLIEQKPKPSDKVSPTDLIYKIQIGAYSKGVPAYRQKIYKKLSVIRTIDSYSDEKGVVVYTTGNLTRYEDALKMQNQVKQEGIQDAVVVPYLKGKRITLEQAKQIEANYDI